MYAEQYVMLCNVMTDDCLIDVLDGFVARQLFNQNCVN